MPEGPEACPLLRYTDADGRTRELLLTDGLRRLTVGRAPETAPTSTASG